MKLNTLFVKTLLAGAVAVVMAGCSADGDGSVGGSGGLNPGGDSDIFPNNGTVTTVIRENGTDLTGHFICTASAQQRAGATTTAGANGLLGGPLTQLLNTLGGNSVTALTNSVRDKELTIDGTLETGSTFTLTAALLGIPGVGALIDSIDQNIFLPSPQPAGAYAVFGLTFPGATVEASLLSGFTVTTYLGDTEQESEDFSVNAIDLLGFSGVGDQIGFFGLKTTQPYNRVTISLIPTLIAANVGDAMKAHEMCTNGNFVP